MKQIQALGIIILLFIAVWTLEAGFLKGRHIVAEQQQAYLTEQLAPAPVEISLSLFHNQDSLDYYRELAYLHEDPKGLYVMGAVGVLMLSPDWPDSIIFTMPREEGDLLLWRSAQLGYPDAQQLIRNLVYYDNWILSVPFDE